MNYINIKIRAGVRYFLDEEIFYIVRKFVVIIITGKGQLIFLY